MNIDDTLSFTPGLSLVDQAAATLLRDRVLTISNWNRAHEMAPFLSPDLEGLVITGKDASEKMRTLRAAFPNLVLISEPEGHRELEASLDKLWYIPEGAQDGLWDPPSVEDVLQGQRGNGASVVILPAGYIEMGEDETVLAMIEAANSIPGDDVALPLYLSSGWLRIDREDFLIEVINRSKHPVLLAFASQKNPLDSITKLERFRRIMKETGCFAWRTDLAGLDAIAHGGAGAAIGDIPALRRITAPGDKGQARYPQDDSPYTLVPHHLRWLKPGAMRTTVYVAVEAPSCQCTVCNGLRVDRFTKADQIVCGAHNRELISSYAREIIAAPQGLRPSVWSEFAKDAIVAHEVTSAAIGKPWKPPVELQHFVTI